MTPRRLLLLLLVLTLPFAVPARSARAEDKPVKGADTKTAPKPAKKNEAKKRPAQKKPYDYDQSKYKSLRPAQTSTYKFNAKGEPIGAEEKKSAANKKKRSEPPEAGSKDASAACGSAESCAEKKIETDAL